MANTITFRLCAFSMYGMWWNKPLTAHEPFILRGDWVEPLCAYMYMSSELSGDVDESFESQTTVKTLFAFLNLYSKAPEIESVSLSNPPADEAGAQSMDTTQSVHFKYSPKSCSPLLREKQLEKASGTAFFERRPPRQTPRHHLHGPRSLHPPPLAPRRRRPNILPIHHPHPYPSLTRESANQYRQRSRHPKGYPVHAPPSRRAPSPLDPKLALRRPSLLN